MKRHWNEQELAEHWTLTSNELQCIRNRTNRNRIGFAVTLKFFQMAGRFPNDARDIPGLVLEHIARQLDIDPGSISQYRFSGRSHERDRAQVRALAEFRPATRRDANRLAAWLEAEVLPTDHRHGHVQDAAIAWCRQNRIEPPAPTRLDRVIGSAMNTFQNKFFLDSFAEIPLPCRASIDKLLEASDDADSSAEIDRTPMAELCGPILVVRAWKASSKKLKN